MGRRTCSQRPFDAGAGFVVPTPLCVRLVRPASKKNCAPTRWLVPGTFRARPHVEPRKIVRACASKGSELREEPGIFQVGDIVSGRYRIIGILGRGANGVTYDAIDTSTDSEVALKAISLRGMRSWKTLDLFERESVALKSLSHPAIPEYVDSVEVDSQGDRVFVLAQKKAAGASLQELLDSGFRFTIPQISSIFRQLLGVLKYLGELNPPMLHRDVKPANLIVNVSRTGADDVSLALVDFGAVNTGVSKVNADGSSRALGSTVVGTFGFMPPEAFGGGADVRSDLYAAGATILFAISGKSPSEVPKARLKLDCDAVVAPAKRFELGNVYTVMKKLLEPAPEDRYKTARESLAALDARDRLGGFKRTDRAGAQSRSNALSTGKGTFGAFDSAFDDGRGNGDGFYSSNDNDDNLFGRSSGLRTGTGGGIARRVKNYFSGSASLSKAPARQPAGSRVVVDRDPEGRLLKVFIPPKGFTGKTASTGAFAVAWTGFVGFWTAGVVTGGAPIVFGLFSVPFWYAGAQMAKRVVDDVKSTTELVISAGGGEKEVYFFSLRVAGALGDVKEVEGDSRDLDGVSVDATMYVNDEEVTSLFLLEGVNKHKFGEDLELTEQTWLADEITRFLRW